MKKISIVSLAIITVIVFGALAVPKTLAEKQDKNKNSVKIEGATPENPVVYLGEAYDKKVGKIVEGYAIVHYAKNNIKPTKPNSGAVCYGYISKGAKWKSIENWTFDSALNSQNLDPYVLKDNMEADISKWEEAVDGDINNSMTVNILGSGSVGPVLATLGKSLDYKNEVKFAGIDNSGAIAVTYIWGIFSGKISQKEIVEWDQVYDNVDFNWSMTGEADKMDFENIATHELGHSIGLGDLYNSVCNQETMYGYASEGQTNKRDLNAGDIMGIDLLY